MRSGTVRNLADCSEFRLTLEARPPAIVHGTACLLLVSLGSAVGWSALTEANLVVRAPGRTRPLSPSVSVFVPESGERPGHSVGRQVRDVSYRQGDTVKEGQPLLQLDTLRLDQEASRLELELAAARRQKERLARQLELTDEQFQAARAKAEAELDEAEEEIRLARQKREAELRQAEEEHRIAVANNARLQELGTRRAASETEQEEAGLKVRQAESRVAILRQPINERRLESRRRALELVEKDFAVQREQIETERAKTESEIKQSGNDLAALRREHERSLLTSPIDGMILSREVKPGDMLERGQAVVEVAHQETLHFEAAVPSTEVGHLRTGMPARVKLDAYDFQHYGTLPGTVVLVSPDSRMVENQLVYEVRVRLDRDKLTGGDRPVAARLGLTGTVEIITDRQSLLSILRRKIHRSISL